MLQTQTQSTILPWYILKAQLSEYFIQLIIAYYASWISRVSVDKYSFVLDEMLRGLRIKDLLFEHSSKDGVIKLKLIL